MVTTAVTAAWVLLVVGIVIRGLNLFGTYGGPGLPTVVAIISATAAVLFFAAGAVLLRSDDQRGNAAILAPAGTCWVLCTWIFWYDPSLRLVHYVLGPSMWAFVAWVVLRYPDDRLTLGERRCVLALFCWLSGVPHADAALIDQTWYPVQHAILAGWPIGESAPRSYVDGYSAYLFGWALLELPFLCLASRQARVPGGQRVNFVG